MKRLPVLHWLTALALLLGQWGMLVHAGEHPIDGVDDALCVVCVQGHSLDQLQLPATNFPDARVQTQAVVVSADSPAAIHLNSRPNIRGPPNLLQN